MRRAGVLSAALACGVLLAPVAHATHEACRGSGTIPGTSPSLTWVGTGDAEPYRTVYVDDRGMIDDDAQGLWIYVESNGWAGLQRGGPHVLAGKVPWVFPIQPIVVLPPDPDRPVLKNGLILFPNGLGGASEEPFEQMRDGCREYGGPGQPDEGDTLLF